MVLGVLVHGDTVQDHEVVIDSLFRAVPVATRLGVPLVYKKLPGTGGDDSKIRSNAIVRFMADPDDGFAPGDWQYGGQLGPAPPVALARRDKVPFSEHDWRAISDYMEFWLEELSEVEENRSHVSERMLTPAAMQDYVRAHQEEHQTALLPLQFPVHSMVKPSGLSEASGLNGLEGEVVQYSRDRVGVRFPERGVVALRPERLQLQREAAVEPAAKRQDIGAAKEAKQSRETRAKELEQQEAMVIASRFCECLHQDTFPEMGDLHLFGVGCEYRSRAQEVLAVWQGAVKGGDLSADAIAKALVEGKVKELFEDACRRLAKSRTPNATYAMELIKNNFAALEWDDL